jgi:type I restriction enzyme R subunit
MTWEYSEDNLIEQTAIDLFFNQLGWDTLKLEDGWKLEG